MKYLPFLSGKYTTVPGLILMEKAVQPADALVFQIDDSYENYLRNKQICRQENTQKYYCENTLWAKTASVVNWFIVNKLLKEYPHYFTLEKDHDACTLLNKKNGTLLQWNLQNQQLENSIYHSLFDALCCQVQEDMAICQLNRDEDWLAAIHLCAPNHWAPEDKIGKPFNAVYAPVTDMGKTTRSYSKMLDSIIHKGPFTRFAWGIATDTRLNHHPVQPTDANADEWHGRITPGTDTKFYIRTERQNMIGFPGVNAFLFTIRTYFYDIEVLEPHEKFALSEALDSMSAATLAYKGLTDKTELIKERLK
jgi:dimethylamine monooxygenase subunit A